MDKQFYLRLFLTLGMIFTSTAVFAQFNDSEYEDFSNFSTDPVELDQEYHQIFGRFFQSSFSVGTAILTGDLADAYDAGLLLRIMFVYYFDPIWATELGVGFSQHQGRYETTEAGPVVTTPIDFDVEMMLIPIFLGLRYGFNRRSLSRGIATMNPYVSAQVEIVIRREKVEDIFAGPSSNSRFDEAGERKQKSRIRLQTSSAFSKWQW